MTSRKSTLATLALSAALLAGAASIAEAGGWSRSGSFTGPRGGTWNSYGRGYCAGGSCNSRQSFTGPFGRSITRRGSTACSGGTCNHSSTWTGPNGGTATYNSTWRRY